MTKTEARQAGRDVYHCIVVRTSRVPDSPLYEVSDFRREWYNGYLEARLADKFPRWFPLEVIV